MRATDKTTQVPTFEGITAFIKSLQRFRRPRYEPQPRFLFQWSAEDVLAFQEEVARENTGILSYGINIEDEEDVFKTYIYQPRNYIIIVKEA